MPRAFAIGLVSLGLLIGISFAADRPSGNEARSVELTPKGTLPGAKQPQAVVVGNDTVHVAFAGGDSIYITTSTDAGKSFETPHRVADLPNLMAGMRRGPRIVANEKAIVISAIGSKDGNLVAWRSTDGGKSWQGPSTVNSEAKSAREGLHGLAMGPDGQVACVWLDLRHQKTELCCSVSTDGGETWGENQLAYRSPDGSICECCHPSVTYDGGGKLTVMWRNSLGGNRDIYLANSSDGGQTFSKATKLGTGSWKKDSCPMDGGDIAVTSAGKAATVWRRDQEIFYTPPGENKEQRLGPGEQPTITAAGNGTYLAWVTRRPGSLMLKQPKATKPVEIATQANDPMLAAGSGRGPVVVVWESGRGRDTSVWFAALPNQSR